jgi:quercetin dioxygenase-like cupin family protein
MPGPPATTEDARMSETLSITPHETVTILTETPELLAVEVRYTEGGRKPPPHLHPAQDEHFEILEGTLHAKVGGTDRVLGAGDTLDVPRGTVHTMWAQDGPVRARWEVRPAGRTAEWFRTIDREQPGLRGFAKLLREYDDVFRLAGPARALPVLVR